MIFSPRFLFSLLWLFELIGHLYIYGFYENLTFDTIKLVLLSIVSFCVGSFLVEKLICNSAGKKKLKIKIANEDYSFKFAFFIMTAYFLIELFVFKIIMDKMNFNVLNLSQYDVLRQLLVNDLVTSKNFSLLLKILFFGVGISLYFLASSDDMNTIFFALMFGFISAILTTGRLALLMYIIGASYLLFEKRIIKIAGLISMAGLFIALFVGIAVIFKKGRSVGNFLDQILWNLNVYVFGSLAAFNHYVANGEPVIDGGAFIPNILRTILDPLFGPFKTRPPINPFIFIPTPTNTYTAFFPVYHDYKYLGLTVYSLVLGIGHEILYLKKHEIFLAGEYYFALSLYPLVMSIFEEAYFSSLGTWFLLLMVPVVMVMVRGAIISTINIFKSNQSLEIKLKELE